MSSNRIVITDANVLINLIHAEILHLLGQLPPFEFVVVEEVVGEISRPDQAKALQDAIDAGHIARTTIDDPAALTLRSELAMIMSKGEAASLAVAVTRGAYIACDERKVFRREAIKRLGQDAILTTPGVMLLGIRANLLTVERADEIKAHLETRRFVMRFKSFRELL